LKLSDENKCETELELMKKIVEKLEYAVQTNSSMLENSENLFKQFLECFFKIFKEIAIFNKKYSNLYTLKG
jgi:hypothetical protein